MITVASHLGIDGDDNIYILDMDHCYVYKLAPDGTFVNRFGGDGLGNGLMHTPSAITIDGAGLVYVADLIGIEVFTGDGRFLRTIALPGSARCFRSERWLPTASTIRTRSTTTSCASSACPRSRRPRLTAPSRTSSAQERMRPR